MSDKGEALKNVFEYQLINKKGIPINIYKNWNTEEMISVETQAIKQVDFFEMSLQTEINIGDVIQPLNSRSFWKVIDIDEDFQEQTMIKFIVKVAKVDHLGNEISINSQGKAIFNAPVYGSVQVGGQHNSQNNSTSRDTIGTQQETNNSKINFIEPSKNKKKRTKSHISINYARLFGAYQIPFLLNIEKNGVAFNPQINKFAKNWEYIHAKPLKNTTWEELNSVSPESNQSILAAVNQNDPIGKRFFNINIDLKEVAKFYTQHPELMPEEISDNFLKQTYDELMSLFSSKMKETISKVIEKYLMTLYSKANIEHISDEKKLFGLVYILDVPLEYHPLSDPEGFMFKINNSKEEIASAISSAKEGIKTLQKITDEFKALIGFDVAEKYRERIINFQENHPEIYSQYFFTGGDELENYSSRPHGEYAFCEIATKSSYKPKEVLERVKFNSDKVGCLILYLKNDSDEQLENIKLTYKEFLKEDNFANSINAQDVENLLASETAKSKEIPYLKPQEELLWLLSIYYKDNKGFPDAYLSSVTRPLRFNYSLKNGEKVSMKIRKPLLEKAMKVSVPFGWGWYYQ